MAKSRFASDTNIIIGGMLLMWGVLAEVYMLTLHNEPGGCAPSSVGLGSVCITTWTWLLIPVVGGLVLTLIGVFNRPIESAAEDLLRTGPFTQMVLMFFFINTVATTTFLLMVVFDTLAGGSFPTTWTVRTGTFSTSGILAILAALSGLIFLVGYSINMTHVRKRQRFLRGYNRAVSRIGRRSTE